MKTLLTTALFSLLLCACTTKKNDESVTEETETTEVVEEEIPEPDVNQELLSAIDKNEINLVRELISKGADVNFIRHSNTPLIRACALGNLEMIKLLIKEGADPNLRIGEFEENISAIERAISNGQIEVVRHLYSQGITAQNPIWHVQQEDTVMFNYLLDQGMDLDAIRMMDNEYEPSKLQYAFENNDNDYAQYLIEKGARGTKDIGRYVNTADQFEMLKNINYDFSYLTKNQIYESIGEAAVFSLLSNRKNEVVQLYLDYGFKPSATTVASLLFEMNDKSDIQDLVLSFLTQKDTTFNINATYEFHQWIYSGNDLSSISEKNQTTLLCLMAFANNISGIEKLLAFGADPLARDVNDKLPIDYAKEENKLAIQEVFEQAQTH